MRLFFLIPLATGLLSSYISLIKEEDISYIFGIIGAGSLILSLILSPWELQLLVLLLVIVNIRQLWLKKISQPNQKTIDINSDNNNKALIKVSSEQFALKKIYSF